MAVSKKSIIIAIFLGLIALLVRLPYLQNVPQWIGANENFIAIDILNGKYHLTNENPHIGPLSPAIVALFLLLFGRHWWISRLVPFSFGIGTVVLTYFLASRIYSKRTGFAAGLWMCVAWYHVIFSSHFPWSNSITPFFTTGFLLSFYHALHSRDNRHRFAWWALSGLAFGLGLQSHPEVLVLAPVIPLAFILKDKKILGWLRKPQVYVLAFSAAAAYANMIYYNLTSRFGSVAFSLSYPDYALTKEYTPTSVLGNYFHEILFLPRMILGYYDDTLPWSTYAMTPLIWIFWVGVISGLIIHFRRRDFYLPSAFLCGMLLIPILNSNYTLLDYRCRCSRESTGIPPRCTVGRCQCNGNTDPVPCQPDLFILPVCRKNRYQPPAFHKIHQDDRRIRSLRS